MRSTGQLFSAGRQLAMAFGGGASVDANGLLVAPRYTVQGNVYADIGGALGALDGQVTSNTTNIAALSTQIGSGSIGLVQQDQATRKLAVGATTDGDLIDVSGTAGDRRIAGVAAGALTTTSTEAVNGSQLFATNQAVAANTADIATLTSTVAGIQTVAVGPRFLNGYSASAPKLLISKEVWALRANLKCRTFLK